MAPSCQILACQIAIPGTVTALDRDRHLEQTANKIRNCLRSKPADIVVLPELSSIDYSRTAFDNLDVLAEALDGPSFQVYSELAQDFGVAVVYGIARREGTSCRISQVVLGPDGTLTGYFDKLHVAQFGASIEKGYFTPGNSLLVFEHKALTIAPIICYDIRFPELTRALALEHGADLILHCGAYARDPSFFSWHQFVVSRAMENQIFVLSLNRAGGDYGNSLFCGPWVDEDTPVTSFPARDEAFIYLEADKAMIESARQQYPFLRDKLHDYGALGRSDRQLQSAWANVAGAKERAGDLD